MDDRIAGVRFNPRDVHDFWPRVLASPVLGALVVNLSGLIDNTRHSTAGLIASYAWFALVAFLIWAGNRRLYFRLPRREDWLLRPWSRLGLLLAVILLYTIPVAAALLWIWREVTGDIGTRQHAFATALFAVVALVIAITHVYETVFLLHDWESDRLRSARLERARLEAELESLGREVDPHFLFNNLNALVHLIEQRSDAAAGFIRTLSATYRYVLESRGRPLVPVADELEALERHRALADIRYAGGVRLDTEVPPEDAQQLCLPPVSLAELFQNALKHNIVAPESPLHIRVRIDGTTLVFENDLRRGTKASRSTGIGLANLRERFRIATGGTVAWGVEGDRFVVTLPLVRAPAAAAPARNDIMRRIIAVSTLVIWACASSPVEAQMSDLERQRLVSHMDMTSAWLMDEVSGLSDEQLHFRAEPGKWSIAQVVEHLAVVAAIYWDDLQRALKPPGAKRRSGMTDADVLWYGIDRTRREQAIPGERPSEEKPDVAKALEAYRKYHDRLLQYIKTTRDDLRSYIVERQGSDAYQWALLISTHEQRHILQIREVKASPGFPEK